MSLTLLARLRAQRLLFLAGASVALALAATSAQALIVPSKHSLRALTSVSALSSVSELANADTLFDRSVSSSGLSGQGQVSVASASQTFTRHDRESGFAGSAEVSLGLSGGVSGEAGSAFTRNVLIADGSDFSYSGLLEATGNAPVRAFLSVSVFAEDNGSTTNLFFAELLSGVSQELSGLLDAGHYLFSFVMTANNVDPGESAFGHLDFDLQIHQPTVGGGGGNVPEPQSLALALAALLPALALRKRQQRAR